MRVEIVEHETAGRFNFKRTDHPDVFINCDAGEVLVIQDRQALLITVD